MEAWILHVRREWIAFPNDPKYADEYSVWASEKLALKQAAQYLNTTVGRFDGPLAECLELRQAVEALLKADNIREAINLVSKYTEATPPLQGRTTGQYKCIIKVVRSKFLGSAFE